MQSETPTASVSKVALWAGRIMSALLVVLLLFSGVMKLMKPQEVLEGLDKLGWDPRFALGLGILEITCAIIYAMPRTAVLGAILLTGYMGGAVATHVRLSEPFFTQVLIGVLIWGGLYLRDARLRALIPLRS